MAITQIAALKLSEESYRYFRDDNGQAWKVLLVVNPIRASNVEADVALAPVFYSVTISVSPSDETGEALRDAALLPIVLDSHTHTFTEDEMTAPDFDPDARILSIVEERIASGARIVAGVAAVLDLGAQWSAGGPNG